MAERKNFMLRISDDLYREIEAWANADFRSVNGQIEFLLKLAVEKRKKGKKANEGERVTRDSDE